MEGGAGHLRDCRLRFIWENMFYTLFSKRYDDGRRRLYIRHTTSAVRAYRHFVDGYYIDEKEWKLGDYAITLKDGSTLLSPVVYGFNISKSSQDWDPPRPYDYDGHSTNPTLAEVAYTTYPVQIGDHTEYIFGIDLPEGAEVASVSYRPLPGHEDDSVSFTILGCEFDLKAFQIPT